MNAVPPTMLRKPVSSASAEADAAGQLEKWTALRDVAAVIAMLAGLEPQCPSAELGNVSAISEAPPWLRDQADCALDDLAAVMEMGSAALLGVTGRGGDPKPAALALWHEFSAGRAALLALLSTPAASGSSR